MRSAVRRHRPALAKTLARPANLTSTLSFLAATVVGSSMKKHAAADLDGNVLLVLILFVAGTWFIGWLLGRGESADRQLMAATTSIRNAGLVLLFGITLFPKSGVDTVVLAYALLMIVPNAAITIAQLARAKHRSYRASHTLRP